MKVQSVLFAVSTLVLTQACSFSMSSESISDSVSESSGSFSDSVTSIISSPSSSSDDTNSYQVQVMNYTNIYFTSAEFDAVTYNKGMTELAQAQGVTNWEDDEDTLQGVGRGLKKANISGALYQTYANSIANNKATRVEMIQKGYDSQE